MIDLTLKHSFLLVSLQMTLIAQMEKSRQVSSTPFSNKMRVYPTIFYTCMEKVVQGRDNAVVVSVVVAILLDQNCRCFRAKDRETTYVRVHAFFFHHTETP